MTCTNHKKQAIRYLNIDLCTEWPYVSVTWLKGSQILDESGRYRISTVGNTSTLTIPAVLAPDAGMFAVEASNEKGIFLFKKENYIIAY